MDLADLPNPFRKQAAGDELRVPAGNVPDLHKGVLDALRTAAKDVRGSDDGTSVQVVGETGSGKTHLIAQLRTGLSNDPTAVVVRVPLTGSYAAQVWRSTRGRLVSELLQKGWHPNEPDLTGIYRLLKNRFPKWHTGIFGGMFTSAAGELGQLLTQFAADREFCYELRQVVPRLWEKDAATVTAAADWLRGKRLGDDDRKRLGLPATEPSDYELEQTAREVVLSLLRLAGDCTTLVVCFDEVEALLTGAADESAVRAFATMAVDLIAEPGSKVVVTFVRPDTPEKFKQAVEKSSRDKLAQQVCRLNPLEHWERVVQVACARLQSEPLLKAERAKRGEQFWPLGEQFLRKLLADHPLTLTPRHLLRACAAEYERVRNGKPVVTVPPALVMPPPTITLMPPTVVPPPQPPPPQVPTDRIAKLWQKRRDHHRKHLHALDFDTLFGLGLPWLAGAVGLPLTPAGSIDPKLPDVSLILRPTAAGGKPVGVAFCHQDLKVLWRRLDKLTNQAQAAKAHFLVGRLALVRPKSLPLTAGAEERFGKIERGGSVVLFPTDDQLADLAAYQELLTRTQSGDVTEDGKPLPADAYLAWAAAHLTAEARQLAAGVFGGTAVAPPPAPPTQGGKVAKKPSPALFA